MNIRNLLGLRMASGDIPHVTLRVLDLATVGRFVEIRMHRALHYAIWLNVLIQFIY